MGRFSSGRHERAGGSVALLGFVLVTAAAQVLINVFLVPSELHVPNLERMGSTSEILLPLRIALDMRGDGASWMEEMNLPAELPETRARVHLIRTLNSDLGDMSQWVFLKCDDPVLQSAHSEPAVASLEDVLLPLKLQMADDTSAGSPTHNRVFGQRQLEWNLETSVTWGSNDCQLCDLFVRLEPSAGIPSSTLSATNSSTQFHDEVSAHQLILAAESAVIKEGVEQVRAAAAARRKCSPREINSNLELAVVGVSPEVVASLLDFAYKGVVRVQQKHLLEIADVSRRLQMTSLHALATRHMVEQMHVGNAVAHLVASKVLDIPGLWALAHNTTLARFDQLWASNVFLHMPASLLWDVLGSHELHAPSEELVLAVLLRRLGRDGGECARAPATARVALSLARWTQLRPATWTAVLSGDATCLPGPSSWYTRALTDCHGVLTSMVGRARAIAALDRRERASGDQPPPASAHGDGGILSELWQIERNWGFDVQAAKQTLLMKSHTSNIVALVGLRSGWLVSGSQDGSVRAWDPAVGSNNHTIEDMSPFMSAIVEIPSSSPTGNDKLAVSSADGDIRICDTVEWTCDAKALKGVDVRAMTLVHLKSVGGFVLVSGGPRAALKAWDVRQQGRLLGEIGTTQMSTVALASVDGLLVSGESCGTIRVWSTRSTSSNMHSAFADWREIKVLKQAHTLSVRALTLLNGKLLSGSDDGNVSLWSSSWEREITVQHSHNKECPVGVDKPKETSRSIGMAYHGTIPKTMYGVNRRSASVVVSQKPLGRQPLGLSALDISSSSSVLDLEQVGYGHILREAAHKQPQAGYRDDETTELKGSVGSVESRKEDFHVDGVNSVFWGLGRGFWFISGGDDGAIRIWDAHNGRCIRAFEDHKHDDSGGGVRTLWHVSEYIASGGTDETIKMYK